jgi:hypothetical protein
VPEMVATGAMLECSFCSAPTGLVIARKPKLFADKLPAANINDSKIANVPTLAMCNTRSNPAVAAETAAAMGAPTPAPCAPNLASPWAPGATKVMVEGVPAVLKSYTLSCMWGRHRGNQPRANQSTGEVTCRFKPKL